MIYAVDLRDEIIIPVLKTLGLYSEGAVNLLLGTAAVESDMGFYLRQHPGPAVSIYQIEPKTYKCVINNFLVYRPLLMEKALSFNNGKDDVNQLTGNLYLATAIARIKYFRSPRKIPQKNDLEALADMWRMDYNSILGAHETPIARQKFKDKYEQYVGKYAL